MDPLGLESRWLEQRGYAVVILVGVIGDIGSDQVQQRTEPIDQPGPAGLNVVKNDELVAYGFEATDVIVLIFDMNRLLPFSTSEFGANGDELAPNYLELFKSKALGNGAKCGPTNIVSSFNRTYRRYRVSGIYPVEISNGMRSDLCCSSLGQPILQYAEHC